MLPKKYEGPAVGIDLGTTYSCVAVWQEQHNRVDIIHNEQGNRTTPSCVAFTDKQRLIGDDAKNQAASNPLNMIFGNVYSLLLCISTIIIVLLLPCMLASNWSKNNVVCLVLRNRP